MAWDVLGVWGRERGSEAVGNLNAGALQNHEYKVSGLRAWGSKLMLKILRTKRKNPKPSLSSCTPNP